MPSSRVETLATAARRSRSSDVLVAITGVHAQVLPANLQVRSWTRVMVGIIRMRGKCVHSKVSRCTREHGSLDDNDIQANVIGSLQLIVP